MEIFQRSIGPSFQPDPQEELKPLTAEDRSHLVKEFLSEHKSAYCQGFEEIYALEKIDIRSLRRISEPSRAESPKQSACQAEEAILRAAPKAQDEAFFDGEECSSFRLYEPVHVLDLPANLTQTLIDLGLSILKDLLALSAQDWQRFKGMGQAHIDEIQEKLRQYVPGGLLNSSGHLEPLCLVRALLGDLDRKQQALLLAGHHLTGVALSAGDRAALRHLSDSGREEMRQKALQASRSAGKRAFLEEALRSIAAKWLTPWMRARHGFILKDELEERLQQVSSDPGSVEQVFALLTEIYAPATGLFGDILPAAEPDVLCCDRDTSRAFHAVAQRALSYFYKERLVYSVEELVAFCLKEWAREWQEHPAGFVAKVLATSRLFLVRKTPAGKVAVSLA